jgi:hypothetical protein
MRNWGDGFMNDHVITFSVGHELQESLERNLFVLIICFIFFILLGPASSKDDLLTTFTSRIDPASSAPIALPDSRITSL